MTSSFSIQKPFSEVDPNSPRTQNDLQQLNDLIRHTSGCKKIYSDRTFEKLEPLEEFIKHYFLYKLKIQLQVSRTMRITYIDLTLRHLSVAIPLTDEQKVEKAKKKSKKKGKKEPPKILEKMKQFLNQHKIGFTEREHGYKLSNVEQTEIFLTPENMTKLLKVIKQDVYSPKKGTKPSK